MKYKTKEQRRTVVELVKSFLQYEEDTDLILTQETLQIAVDEFLRLTDNPATISTPDPYRETLHFDAETGQWEKPK